MKILMRRLRGLPHSRENHALQHLIVDTTLIERVEGRGGCIACCELAEEALLK